MTDFTIADPMNAFSKAQMIGNRSQDAQMQGMQIAQAQNDFARKQQMNQLYQQTGGDPVAMQKALTDSGDMEGAMQFGKMNAVAQQAQQEAKLGDLAYRSKAHEYIGQKLYNSQSQQDLDAIHAEGRQLLGDEMDNLPQQWSPEMAKHYGEASMTFAQKEALADRREQQAQRQEDRAANRDFRQQSLDIQRQRIESGSTPTSSVSDAAIDNAASRYNTDGTLPSLGMGKSAGSIRGAILSRAAEMSGGASPDQRSDQLVRKTQGQALGQLQKQYTMVSAFEKNAQKNGDLALSLADKTDRTGSPIVNKWIQAGQKSVTGDPDIKAFNAANETFVNEYAKIMSGSMGNTPVSDSARAHAHEMLSTIDSPEAYKAVHSVLRQEMGNRISGLEDELGSAKQGMYQKQPVFGNKQPKPQNTPSMSGW